MAILVFLCRINSAVFVYVSFSRFATLAETTKVGRVCFQRGTNSVRKACPQICSVSFLEAHKVDVAVLSTLVGITWVGKSVTSSQGIISYGETNGSKYGIVDSYVILLNSGIPTNSATTTAQSTSSTSSGYPKFMNSLSSVSLHTLISMVDPTCPGLPMSTGSPPNILRVVSKQPRHDFPHYRHVSSLPCTGLKQAVYACLGSWRYGIQIVSFPTGWCLDNGIRNQLPSGPKAGWHWVIG